AEATSGMVDALERYGRYLGIAFQIVDDLLDLVGDEQVAGKSLGTDLEQQKLTLPLIRLLSQLNEADRRRVRSILVRRDERAFDALRPWLESSDALAYARNTARDYAKRAAAQLRTLPAGPERSLLRRLAKFVVERRQ
ncbi:MAG TPA: polyprenyl synthetase family protein, partial [Pirellulales bacterium]|nr:polyprenyl synthetase family protein [Pirellulales bacterium]